MSLILLLCVILIQDVYGTFFPPVSDRPPIPAQSVRTSPQRFYIQEELPPDVSQLNDEGLFPPDIKPDEPRWYYQENQSRESSEAQTSIETFDRYYQSGEQAIGPVATPIPDDTYLAQSSSISKLNPTDIRNARNSDIWILRRASERQYIPERWIQIPAESIIQVVNQDSGVPVATDNVKSIVAPASYGIPPNTQFPPNPAANIVQARSFGNVGIPKMYTDSQTLVKNAPVVEQIVDIPPANVKQVVQQQIISDTPPILIQPPASAQISSKKFTVPPPPPPPLKGIDSPPKVISSVPVNIVPDSNILVSGKNVIPDTNFIAPGKNVMQQVRHVWIPTSERTGKFITIPISGSINTDKAIVNKGLSLDSTPVTISDTWVLRQDGPIPSFEQQKTALSPIPAPIVQSGKILFQEPTIVQVDEPSNPPIVATIDSPKNPPIISKGVASNAPLDIWPIRKDIDKTSEKSTNILISELQSPSVKSDTLVVGKSLSAPQIVSQKSLLTNAKTAIPPPIPPPSIQIVNGKPCPIPPPVPQKSLFPPSNPTIISAPRVIATQKRLPFARIVRVNRYPTGSYYLLNQGIRPSYYSYPNPTVIQQPKTGLINLAQTKQIPIPFQNIQSVTPFQTKQISIPVQSKPFASSIPAKQTPFPYLTRQIIIPVSSPKSNRIIYPRVQAIRYAYPWNSYLNSGLLPGKGIYVPQFSPLKTAPVGMKSKSSESSSSENSSSESSSEISKEKREKKAKKEEKSRKEEKSKKEETSEKEEDSESKESNTSEESEKEIESEAISVTEEKESEEKSSEAESNESLETAENGIILNFHVKENEPEVETA